MRNQRKFLGEVLVIADDVMMYLGSTVLGLPAGIFILFVLRSFGAKELFAEEDIEDPCTWCDDQQYPRPPSELCCSSLVTTRNGPRSYLVVP